MIRKIIEINEEKCDGSVYVPMPATKVQSGW